MNNDTLLQDFTKHLKAQGKSPSTIKEYRKIVRRFVKHIGNERLDRLSEDRTRSFFAGVKGKVRQTYAVVVSRFLKFSVSRLPAVITAQGAEFPRAPTKTELALRQKWTLDKLVEQKGNDDDLIAKLARKVIDGYLICQQQIKGEQNLDDLVRYADECRELIESNLPLFMRLSAHGRNVHSAIDERVQK
jgi:hypothetical protein